MRLWLNKATSRNLTAADVLDAEQNLQVGAGRIGQQPTRWANVST